MQLCISQLVMQFTATAPQLPSGVLPDASGVLPSDVLPPSVFHFPHYFLLQQAGPSISPAPARPLAHRRVTAPRVEAGDTFLAVAPRRSIISAVTGPASVPGERRPDSAQLNSVENSKAQKVVLNTIEYKGQKAYFLAPQVCVTSVYAWM